VIDLFLGSVGLIVLYDGVVYVEIIVVMCDVMHVLGWWFVELLRVGDFVVFIGDLGLGKMMFI